MIFDTFDRTGQAEYHFPRSVVYRALVEAVGKIKGMTIEVQDDLACRLDIKAGMSVFSWGEKISVVVLEKSPLTAAIAVQSGAKTIFGSGTTHGKNRENVKLIINKTSAILLEHGEKWINELDLAHNISLVAGNANNSSIADEFIKLVSLRDQGVLSIDEFTDQKTRLLGPSCV